MPDRPDDNWSAFRQREVESLYELIREGFDSNEEAERQAEIRWELGVRARLIHLWAKQPASLN